MLFTQPGSDFRAPRLSWVLPGHVLQGTDLRIYRLGSTRPANTGQQAAVGFTELLPPPKRKSSGLMVLQAQLPRLPCPFGDQPTNLEVAHYPGRQLELYHRGVESCHCRHLSGMVASPLGSSAPSTISLWAVTSPALPLL